MFTIFSQVSVFNKKSMKKKELLGWFSLGSRNTSEEETAHWEDMMECKGEPVQRWHVLMEPWFYINRLQTRKKKINFPQGLKKRLPRIYTLLQMVKLVLLKMLRSESVPLSHLEKKVRFFPIWPIWQRHLHCMFCFGTLKLNSYLASILKEIDVFILERLFLSWS